MKELAFAGASGRDLYRWMALARELDVALCELNSRWFPCRGEEASIVGSFVDLQPRDIAAPHYRDPFVVYVLRGAQPWRLVAQVLGRPAGYNGGRSVPFTGPPRLGVVPWVAGDLGTSLGVATGAAFALQEAGRGGVCVCTFGDGTANRGDFHEAVNLAAIWKLPIVFVCQNNGWSISQRAVDYLRAPIHRRASGYGIPGHVVDGQDVEAVREAVALAVEGCRRGEGPSLIEARTWRATGHWAADDQAYRRPDEEKPADPLQLMATRLLERGEAQAADLEETRSEVAALVAEAVRAAREADPPTAEQLGGSEVYA